MRAAERAGAVAEKLISGFGNQMLAISHANLDLRKSELYLAQGQNPPPRREPPPQPEPAYPPDANVVTFGRGEPDLNS